MGARSDDPCGTTGRSVPSPGNPSQIDPDVRCEILSRRHPALVSGPPPCDDPLEIGFGSRIAVDRHMLRNVEIQPLDVAEQHGRVFADVRKVPSLRRRVEVGVHEDLRLRQIGHQHVEVWLRPCTLRGCPSYTSQATKPTSADPTSVTDHSNASRPKNRPSAGESANRDIIIAPCSEPSSFRRGSWGVGSTPGSHLSARAWLGLDDARPAAIGWSDGALQRTNQSPCRK